MQPTRPGERFRKKRTRRGDFLEEVEGLMIGPLCQFEFMFVVENRGKAVVKLRKFLFVFEIGRILFQQ